MLDHSTDRWQREANTVHSGLAASWHESQPPYAYQTVAPCTVKQQALWSLNRFICISVPCGQKAGDTPSCIDGDTKHAFMSRGPTFLCNWPAPTRLTCRCTWARIMSQAVTSAPVLQQALRLALLLHQLPHLPLQVPQRRLHGE